MRINSFLNNQGNNYNKDNNSKKTSFGLPHKYEKMKLEDYIKIPTCYRVSQEAIRAEIKLKESMKKYNEEYKKQVNETADKAYKELQKRENATSTYDAGFADHHND